jgi:microcin C transport system permease protein
VSLVLTLLHLAVVLAVGWLFTWKLAPRLALLLVRTVGALLCLGGAAFAFGGAPRMVRRAGDAWRWRPKVTPVTAKRLARFRRIKRGHWSFVGITTLFGCTMFLELTVNSRPLVIHYEGKTSFPAVAEWLDTWVPVARFPSFLKASDFGQAGDGPLDVDAFRRRSRDAAGFRAEVDAKRAEIAKDREAWPKAFPAPAADASKGAKATWEARRKAAERGFARREAEVDALAKSLEPFEAGKAWCLMPLYPHGPSDLRHEFDAPPPNSPSLANGIPLGTDLSGRDVLALLLYGFRISLAFALVVSALGYLIGITVGALQGYYGGWIDIASQRFVEIWSAIPFLFVIMIIVSMIQPTFLLLVVLLVVLRAWIGITYYVRGEYLREKAKDYVQAAIGSGVGDAKIMLRHILPNTLVPVITFAPFGIVGLIGSLVSLDFLGFGLPPGTPSWGALLRQGLENVRFHPHLTIIPSVALAVTLFCVVMVGEAVREAFDPKVFSRLR